MKNDANKQKRSLANASDLGAPEGTRTPDLLIRSFGLYPKYHLISLTRMKKIRPDAQYHLQLTISKIIVKYLFGKISAK